MSKFPLYDRLSHDVPKKDLSVKNKKLFIKKIQTFDDVGHELVYALIRMYQNENDDVNTSFTLPYGGTFTGSDINFDLDKVPKTLKQILFKFVTIHWDKMEEERELTTQTPVKRV
jgi:hypothetical protein